MVMKDKLVKNKQRGIRYSLKKFLQGTLLILVFVTLIGIPTYLLLR